MALDINKIKQRLDSLSNKKNRSNLLWKPSKGKQVIRIVPYKYDDENCFRELYFHYNINGKTYLSPSTYKRPDPICEFSQKLQNAAADQEEWKQAKQLEPKLRTYVPVIVRGEEDKGVRFWGFGKMVFQELLGIISDPYWGDITDISNGHDLTVEFKTPEETKKSYPETSLRPSPKKSPAVDPKDKELVAMLDDQTKLEEIFTEPTYDEMKEAMDTWLNTGNSEKPEGTDYTSERTDNNPKSEGQTTPTPTGKKDGSTNNFNALFDS